MHGTVGFYVPVGENLGAEAEFHNFVVMQR